MRTDLDPVFLFMRAQYRSGMLDAAGPLLGRALDEAMSETGRDMEDLLMRLEALPEEGVERMDRLMGRWSGLLLKSLSAEAPARLLKRMLSYRPLREKLIEMGKKRLARLLAAPLPMPDRKGEG